MAQDNVIASMIKDVFNKDLEMLTEGAALISYGRLFHRWGAATEKA